MNVARMGYFPTANWPHLVGRKRHDRQGITVERDEFDFVALFAVLQHDRGWTMDQVNDTVDRGPENNNIKLEHKVPVHVTYFTAVADEDGNVQAYRDIYGHEKRIRLALADRWNEIQKGRDHLAPVRPRQIVRPQYNDPISDLFKQAFGF